jgi:inhibitor of cysteine peptidase
MKRSLSIKMKFYTTRFVSGILIAAMLLLTIPMVSPSSSVGAQAVTQPLQTVLQAQMLTQLRERLQIFDEAKSMHQLRSRAILQNRIPFSDLQAHWSKAYVNEAYSWGLINGYPDGTFRPDAQLTGLEAIIVGGKLMNCFKITEDLGMPPGVIQWDLVPLWARSALQDKNTLRIALLSQQYGVRQLTRVQFAVMLAKAIGLDPWTVVNGTIAFQDQNDLNLADLGYVLALKHLGIVVGDQGRFYPERPLTRAEAAVMFTKVLALLEKMLPECQISGDTFKITLEENPTTGYSWSYIMVPEGILTLENDAYVSNDSTGQIVGGGGIHTWNFKGLSKGTTTLTFKYYRPWENESTSIDLRIVTVEVGDSGQIISCK